ncbi:lipocalin [Mycolicibacterium duvalii]|uniref:Uncharacterized protein n=1 Tax=Mycolicibacterium duvalii TaxID=39688 RepID=A0A7I7K4R8_9MYCO|nr:lipocalin family protein [Mycolicibacterium duvalii]MCV7369025.1 lipocalin family protein [Mycolicibacterium duvalii]PEG44497.1 lipocalin [Mycolicibacterium duvalii]BBX19075.1 hypothetical protein MDUV_39350 [Mycolicibacterium duvalii]
MTSRRWLLWLGTAGAGACLALGAGQGVASADTESSDAAGTTSRSAESGPSREASARSADDDGADRSATTLESRSSEPASVPTSATQRDTEVSGDLGLESDAELDAAEPAVTGRLYTLRQEPADDSDVTVATAPVAVTTEPREVRRHAASDTTPVTPAAPVTPTPASVPSAQRISAPVEAAATVTAADGQVTGVKTSRAKLTIPVGTRNYTARTDWYLPTQADGSVAAAGVIWLQHGFLGNKSAVSALARTLSQQTNSIVVAPNLPSFPGLFCSGCWLNGVPMQQGVATLFLGDRASLTTSASAAGYQGALPASFVLSGQSAGGGFATSVGGYYAEDLLSDGSLRGVVMFDGVAWQGRLSAALDSLDDPFVPVYQVAAPPAAWNSRGETTNELVAARPGQFVGATLAGGSHSDSLIGGNALFDFFAQLATGFSPPGNTQAVYTLSTGWINDMYQGLGPLDGTGIYGAPDQYIVMGDTAAVVLAPPPVVDLTRYLGTWYEVGSVKQFFSIGLVNTTAVYSLNPDGSIKVQNSGNYFVNNGPKSSITGVALPVDADNNKLNVRFFGQASARPPGNYWIVDLDPDYHWAVVTDPTGFSGFLLTRERTVSEDFYQELLDRASVKGVIGRITPTRQPAAQTVSA